MRIDARMSAAGRKAACDADDPLASILPDDKPLSPRRVRRAFKLLMEAVGAMAALDEKRFRVLEEENKVLTEIVADLETRLTGGPAR